MIRAVIVDLDGTLLNDKNQITENTVEIIKQFQEQGGLFAVNTGRGIESVAPILKEAGLECDCLCLSGAAIYDSKGMCLLSDTMQESEVALVREVEHKYGMLGMYLSTCGVIAEGTYDEARDHYLEQGHIIARESKQEISDEEIIAKHQWVLDMVQFETKIEKKLAEGEQVYKMVMMCMSQDVLQKAQAEMNQCTGILAFRTTPTTIEVNAARVDKGVSTMKYIEMKGILPEETMVIGDSGNDIPMFEIPVGKKVAMANAMEEVKALSTDITKSYLEDGVAYAIQKWGFLPGGNEYVSR